MTEVTRDTLMVMLLDTVRVNRKRIQEATRIRESEEKEFNKYLKIIKISEQNNNNVDSTYFVRGRNSNVNSVIELKDKAYEYFR
ncbi:MAG: hypothetical protein LBQ24_02515 [Candidatus Peribacteria bacterium]|jgi:hypothetical protein|nr:hypothetical protein [Candidatus Peribacteria bacterium]